MHTLNTYPSTPGQASPTASPLQTRPFAPNAADALWEKRSPFSARPFAPISLAPSAPIPPTTPPNPRLDRKPAIDLSRMTIFSPRTALPLQAKCAACAAEEASHTVEKREAELEPTTHLQAQADVPQVQRGKDKSDTSVPETSATTTATTTGSATAGECATVYIWLPSGNNVGHSSIDLAGTYASFWPNQDSYGVGDTILDALNPFGGTESTQATSYAQDVRWEGGAAGNVIQLCCLDIAAMRSHWSRIRSEDYEAAGNNCSTIVGRLINAGLQQADCDVMERPVGECLGAGGEISGIDRPETLLSAVQCLEQRGCDNNWQCDPVPDYSTVPM